MLIRFRRVLSHTLAARACLSLLLCAAAVQAAPSAPGPSDIGQKCSSLYGAGWRPVTGTQNAAAPAAPPKPAKGVPFLDAAFGSCVVRLTAHDQEPPKGAARSDYARRQSFNADDSRILVSALDGHWHLYGARSLAYEGEVKGLAGDAEPQWHPKDPDLLYYLPSNGIGLKLMLTNVRTGETRVAADFGMRLKAIWPDANAAWTRSEGSPSADGRYWAFLVDGNDWQGRGLFTYDLVEDRILAAYDLKANGRSRPDHLSMSLSGKYVVVSWSDNTTVFSREFKQPMKLLSQTQHSDLALSADGEDVYVAIDYEAHGGPVFMTNLRTGARTDLFDTYVRKTTTALHVSGRAFKKPGWVAVSTYAEAGSFAPQWLHAKVMAVELKPQPRIVSLARHQVKYNKYFTAPVASVNRDFTRVLFNSNWGVNSETDVDAYLIALPASWPR